MRIDKVNWITAHSEYEHLTHFVQKIERKKTPKTDEQPYFSRAYYANTTIWGLY